MVSAMCFFKWYYNYLCRILEAICSFNGTAHFLMLKFAAIQFYQCTFFQGISEVPVTMKQIYHISYICRAASIILK